MGFLSCNLECIFCASLFVSLGASVSPNQNHLLYSARFPGRLPKCTECQVLSCRAGTQTGAGNGPALQALAGVGESGRQPSSSAMWAGPRGLSLHPSWGRSPAGVRRASWRRLQGGAEVAGPRGGVGIPAEGSARDRREAVWCCSGPRARALPV